MAIDPEDNKDQLSEEEQLRQSISDLIDEYSEVLRETGESDEARNATIEAFKKTLEALSGDTERLKGIQNALNGRIEATVMSSRNYGGEIESIVTRLNEVVESITNQSDLSNRILGSFKKIRSVGNAIADDADLSYVRSTKYMENQQDI
jgi:DNA repair exonuclease SbcCD ATPase subunit